LRAFFADFLRLFDSDTAARLDLSNIDFRDTEAFLVREYGGNIFAIERSGAGIVAGTTDAGRRYDVGSDRTDVGG